MSTTLQDKDLVSDWGEIKILRSLDDVATLKETEGRPIIIHGSATLGRHLADADLIDRYHLPVFPVVLGAGKRLFSDTDRASRTSRWWRASSTATESINWSTTPSADEPLTWKPEASSDVMLVGVLPPSAHRIETRGVVEPPRETES